MAAGTISWRENFLVQIDQVGAGVGGISPLPALFNAQLKGASKNFQGRFWIDWLVEFSSKSAAQYEKNGQFDRHLPHVKSRVE